jgi:para-nitrobenzyl esterase
MKILVLIFAACVGLAACESPPGPVAQDLGAVPAAEAAVPDGLHDGDVTDTSEGGCKVASPTEPLTIATDRGLLRGAQDGTVVRFLGVPFAAPPVGNLRFKPPEPPACWPGVKNATAYAKGCVQRDMTGNLVGSEDCLYLNIWTPVGALTDGGNRPVMFWIYGGGNVTGATNIPLLGVNFYDGKRLAENRDVVVVSVAYRVGALGFMAHPALTEESPHKSSGNYAILDQIAGLKWVQTNIARFGGDPKRVMVFGESAGAINICTLIASPLAKGLFSSALMQSGFCVAVTLAEREALGATYVTGAGCDQAADLLKCLRSASLDAFFPTSWAPDKDPLDGQRKIPAGNIDGWLLEQHPLDAIEKGTHNHVPLVVGSNSDEHAIFFASKVVLSCAAYAAEVGQLFPTHKDKLLQLYPCSPLDPKKAIVEIYTDSFFTCHARRAARAAVKGQQQSVYRYLYSFVGGAYWWLGAYHTAEIPYVFGTYKSALSLPAEDALSAAIQGYWSRFAATNDPNAEGAVSWGTYDPVRDNALRLDTNIGLEEGIATERCDFWDTITPR